MCDYCEQGKKAGDFDGETYFEIRVARYFGYPAALFMFRNANCIAGYGINACPICGRDLCREGDTA